LSFETKGSCSFLRGLESNYGEENAAPETQGAPNELHVESVLVVIVRNAFVVEF